MSERGFPAWPGPAIGRRALVGGVAASLAARPALAVMPPGRRLAFQVVRKGSTIGTHVVTFEPRGNDLTVQVAVDIAVRFAGLTLYRYTLRATETWQGGVQMAVVSEAMDDGDRKLMRATRRDGRLVVEGSHGPTYTAPEKSISASHWNAAELEAPMIDLQDGELLDFRVNRRGLVNLPKPGGQVEAEHFALSGPAELDLWYDRQGVWIRLRTVARDKSVVEYEQG